MSAREGLRFETSVKSDVAPLGDLVAAALAAGEVHAMRDPTRGGLSAVLNELAQEAKLGVELVESALPVHPAVSSACDMLGLDPLEAANEGKMVIICTAAGTGAVLDAVRGSKYGDEAAVIGEVRPASGGLAGKVWLRTEVGGRRIVDAPLGELLPRIC
jgi:hydrogenase expression/formation protein HypE